MATTAADHLAAVTRRVNTVTRDGGEVRRLTLRRTYDAPLAEVWAALTDPARIGVWFVPVTGDLEVGGRYQLEGNAGGEILECIASERLALTWEYDGESSGVDLSLRPTDSGTLLQLDHTDPLEEDTWAEFGPGAVGIGWEMGLMGLAEHLVSGEPVGVPADIGDLYSGSGAAWADAAIADGDDPDEAHASAARCVGAYTGQ